MGDVILAIQRSLRTLGRGRVWLYMLGPAILSLLAMIGLAVFLLQNLIALFVEQPPMSWIAAWGSFWLAHLLAMLGGWIVILAASYLLATLLSAIIVLPLLLNHLSEVDYPRSGAHGQRQRGGRGLEQRLMGVLAHVPIIGLLAPSLAALAYVHYCLEALRKLRQGAVVSVVE